MVAFASRSFVHISDVFGRSCLSPTIYARNEITKSTLCKGKWHEVTDETEFKGVGRVALYSAQSKAVS